MPSAHWSNVLKAPTRIAGSPARPNESPQVVACQSVRVLYLIIFPRPAVPASAHIASLSSLPASWFLALSRSLAHPLRLTLSLYITLSLSSSSLSLSLSPVLYRTLSNPRVSSPHGGLSPEREPRKQKNHAAEQHVCCARADRTSHPRRAFTSACTIVQLFDPP